MADSSDCYEPSSHSASSNDSEEQEDTIDTIAGSSDRNLLDKENVGPPASDDDPKEKRGKKRKIQRDQWIKEKAKALRNSGKCYVSVHSKKVVEQRKMRGKCSEKCKFACKEFTEEDRRGIFDEYWQLGSLERQRAFINSAIRKLQLSYRRVSVTATTTRTPRGPNNGFYLMLNNREVRVCKLFFLNTLGICARLGRTVKNKTSPNGFLESECRGKHENHKKYSQELVQSVYDHINSIPRVESHYIRADSEREYIDGELTLAEMHRDYENKRKEAGKEAVSYGKYSEIFNYEFNIGFFIPKKDQCDLCTSYENCDDDGKKKIQTQYDTHLTQKEFSREEKDRDKERIHKGEENLVMAIYNLQAIMPCPYGQSSRFYYKSRLNCYNFTVSTANQKYSSI